MANPDRPQAPGYLANLMARLFHEVSGDGLAPLGIRADQFPVLVELWFGGGPVTRASLRVSQESDVVHVDTLVRGLADDGLITQFPADDTTPLVLTPKAAGARDAAVASARKANDAVRSVLDPEALEQFIGTMNRVIDALHAARQG
ncbi:MAG: hypothetical protein ABL879_09385 [Devosia sp.]